MLRNKIIRLLYKLFAKPIFFHFNPESVHNFVTNYAEFIGNHKFSIAVIKKIFSQNKKYPTLSQTISGINFVSPVGLAAGFDYDAKLTQILPSLGFGFGSVGTITNRAYGGNPKPMLGRLPKSKSLMVNKGFKNNGAVTVSNKLSRKQFAYPVGISIGRTNDPSLNQAQSISDIVSAFKIFEGSDVVHSYYELNISCPNLFGDISFYLPHKLNDLLLSIQKLKIPIPLFIKMPIEKDNKTVLALLSVISKHKFVTGVIFGNLQKNRKDPALDADEVAKFTTGNFSGKPTWNRSNELIKIAYEKYGDQLIIIGCGGVFSAEDAYYKITLGASLVQLITGLIFEGPQLVAEINEGLEKILQKNGFKHISEAVGSATR